MEPVTHALTSIALARAGFNKISRAATPLLVVSGTLADVDWVTRLGGAEMFLRGHRTATHALAGAAVIATVVGIGGWFAGRRYSKFAIQLFPAILLCAIGAAAHVLLDLLNSYGVTLLWPFRVRWTAWDLAYPVDSWILFFLLAGLLLPELFRLVLEEIGSRPKNRSRQRAAIASLVLVAAVIGGRAFAHQRAIALLEARSYGGQTPLAFAALPRPSNPVVWDGVVETDNAVVVNLEVPLLLGREFDPDSGNTFFKPQDSETLKNAIASPRAVEFLNFARFPLASVQPEGDGFQVRVRDMRFESELAGRRGVVAVIHLNAQNLVIREGLEFDSPGKE